MNICHCFLLILGITLATCIRGQDDVLPNDSLPVSVSVGYINKVSAKADKLNTKLDRRTTKALQRWQKQEDRIKRKFAKTDSVKATAVFGNAKQQYDRLEQKLQKTSPRQYLPIMDTFSSSLNFLQQNPQLLANTKDTKEKLSNALFKVKGLESQFQKAEDVKAFLKERKAYLKEQLSQLGFAKELKNLDKQAYYYSARVNEYKTLLKDHKKAEQKALALLSKTKLFKDFMRKNSMLASLFRLPGDPNDLVSPTSLAGLQTRAEVNGLIQQQIATGGTNAQQQFSQNLQAAQSKINELKKKINQFGNENSDAEMPEGFKVNSQKVKNFWKKWELGVNVQSNRANSLLPVTSDLGLSAGFRPNDKFVAGVGISGGIGWGKNIRHMKLSYQGVSGRLFTELKLKGSFHAVAGFEMNYRREFKSIEELKNYPDWQKSGLIGLSKVISLKTKFFKKTKLLFLWDALSYQQVPRAKSVILRVGYNF
ncbi:MAG TPA: hypothetical protein VJU78_09815 [Chitinophagaceae bacterium]|nr:hypothetical protein [Chitinophagaceae bacterium]